MQSQVSNHFAPITLLHTHCALVKLSLGRVLPGQKILPFPPLQSKSRVSSNLFRSRVLQMNPPQLTRDYLTDGYISYTFTSRNAEFYVVHLFRRDAASVQAIRDGNGAYSVLIPPSHFSPPIRTQYGDTWVLDHAVRTGGSVVPQQLWAPQGQGDRRRYADQAQFYMPIFFVNMNGGLGVPVSRTQLLDICSCVTHICRRPLSTRPPPRFASGFVPCFLSATCSLSLTIWYRSGRAIHPRNIRSNLPT